MTAGIRVYNSQRQITLDMSDALPFLRQPVDFTISSKQHIINLTGNFHNANQIFVIPTLVQLPDYYNWRITTRTITSITFLFEFCRYDYPATTLTGRFVAGIYEYL